MTGKKATTAPVALFAYRRPDHTAACVAALAANPEAAVTDLVAFLDGPRGEADWEAVERTKGVLQSAKGFATVEVVARPTNVGLARNVSAGLTEVLAARGRVIALEDDLVVSPAFLRYINSGLDLYADDEKIASIHGYVYPTGCTLPSSFFLRGADCWGWGTWERAWKHYEADASRLAERLNVCSWQKEFDFLGAYPYRRMLRDAAAGKVDSWAIRWYASTFVDGMYTLYPGKSMVQNNGHDGTGSHGGPTSRYETSLSMEAPHLEALTPGTNQAAFDAFREYFLSLKPSLGIRIARRLNDLARPRNKG
jgi:hypothetical protein